MNKEIKIKSKIGDYSVKWYNSYNNEFIEVFKKCRVAIVDKNVYEIYKNDGTFKYIDHIILQDAKEDLKTMETCLSICKKLLKFNLKRSECILAVGGGIIQDLSTFVSSIIFRGIPWIFIPTTLLAQADSCIGGKSSINLDKWKNQLGNFYPPKEIHVLPDYLNTLSDADIKSGLGEVIKVHYLSGKKYVDNIIKYFKLPENDEKKLVLFNEIVFKAIKEKARIIEEDEFDTGERLKLNYGHTFGHALETSTHYKIPHGIAVEIGVDIANFVSMKLNKISKTDYQYLKTSIMQNLDGFNCTEADEESFIYGLKHDKKNRQNHYCFILPKKIGSVKIDYFPMDDSIEQIIHEYFANEYPSSGRNQ